MTNLTIAALNETYGLNAEAALATLLYTALGVTIMIGSLVLVNAFFSLNMRKELVEENNTAFGIMIAGMAIGIGIIIAGTIAS